jgi:hypothetical protein
MKAIKNPKRIPRKHKKEIKNVFGDDIYKQIMSGRMLIQPKIITNMTGDEWVEEDHGMTLFFNIDDSGTP